MWAHLLIDNAHENQHWIIDGTPRSKLEAEVIDSASIFTDEVNQLFCM